MPLLLMITSIIDKRWFQKFLFHAFGKHRRSKLVSPFTRLSEDDKREYIWRGEYFLRTTAIEFREFQAEHEVIFDRVRILLGSVAAAMTFRLPDNCFGIYSKIIIYPDYFYSRAGRNYHKGETSPGTGIITLSLRGISEGFKLPFDGVNLIYHEFAHALYLEHKGTSADIFDDVVFEKVEEYAQLSVHHDHPANYFLRDYALTNEHEFFAVAAENFFERAELFSKEMPDLYLLLVTLFKFDPLQIK
jgi:Mlc titration factor MtfA (ptsG expression regulator)